MGPEESVLAGDLNGALMQLQDSVRENPADPKKRVFLFQLLAVLGQWDRALTQLDVSLDLNPETLMMCQTYREAIRCEKLRVKVFSGRQSPLIFGEPEQWMALCVQALALLIKGDITQAQQFREQAYEQAPSSSGNVAIVNSDDQLAFSWIADADSRIGPFIEAFIGGEYYWVPFNQIQRMDFEAPQDLRDLVWAPCSFTWVNHGEVVGLVPCRYDPLAASDTNETDLLLSRQTHWQAHGEDEYSGFGQRMFTTDQDELSLLDIRSVTFNQ